MWGEKSSAVKSEKYSEAASTPVHLMIKLSIFSGVMIVGKLNCFLLHELMAFIKMFEFPVNKSIICKLQSSNLQLTYDLEA